MKFKIATTSYIYPADILTNVDKLKNIVDGIQLIFFESPENSTLPNPVDIKKLKKIASEYDLKYFIHLPVDIDLSTDNDTKRKKSLNTINKMIETGEKINCQFYIAHLNLPNLNKEDLINKKKCTAVFYKFITNTVKNLDSIFKQFPIKKKFLIENTDYNIRYLDYLLFEYGLDLCLDIGHLVLQKEDIIIKIKKYTEKIKLVHLHGINKKKEDHKSLSHFKKSELKKILISCKKTNAAFLVIEVFDEESFFNSYELLKGILKNLFFSYFNKKKVVFQDNKPCMGIIL